MRVNIVDIRMCLSPCLQKGTLSKLGMPSGWHHLFLNGKNKICGRCNFLVRLIIKTSFTLLCHNVFTGMQLLAKLGRGIYFIRMSTGIRYDHDLTEE